MTVAERLRAAVLGTTSAVGRTVRHRLYWQLRLLAKLARIAADGRPIVVGPWHGEVGFEILYWIPFLTWIQDVTGIPRERFHVISRGGVASWYRNLSDHYTETFDHRSQVEFRERNAARKARTGREKQDHISDDERALVAELGLGTAHLLHPQFLYNVLAEFWMGQAPYALASRYLRFRHFAPPPLRANIELPDDFVAVKFYFNPSFPDSARNRQFASDVVTRLARKQPVVLLATGFRVDEHEELAVESANVTSIADRLSARDNLEVQTAVVARSRAFFGTYGGFSYVPAFLRVPSYSFYSDPAQFNLRHLDVMNAASLELGALYGAAHIDAHERLTAAI
jgi:hypothetical protein